MLLVIFLGTYIGGIYLAWSNKTETEDTHNPPGEGEDKKRKRATKAERQDRKKRLQRRSTQRRIRNWCKECRYKYDGKDRMKYRHKVRASKRWLRMCNPSEAWRANKREHKKHVGKPQVTDMRRKGGAGGRGIARAVDASNIKKRNTERRGCTTTNVGGRELLAVGSGRGVEQTRGQRVADGKRYTIRKGMESRDTRYNTHTWNTDVGRGPTRFE
eukprot:4681444-Pleurochrysis_carterae.AAC.1